MDEMATLVRDEFRASAPLGLPSLSVRHGGAEPLLRPVGGARVVGYDIAGDEQKWPLALFEGAIRRVLEGEGAAGDETVTGPTVGVTVHAGEWPGEQSREGLALALSLGVDRIGHGVQLEHRPGLLVTAASDAVGIECCPTANVGSKRVASLESHPLPLFLRAGAMASLSSDNLLASGGPDPPEGVGGASPAGEAEKCLGPVGATIAELRKAQLHAVAGAFEADLGNTIRLQPGSSGWRHARTMHRRSTAAAVLDYADGATDLLRARRAESTGWGAAWGASKRAWGEASGWWDRDVQCAWEKADARGERAAGAGTAPLPLAADRTAVVRRGPPRFGHTVVRVEQAFSGGGAAGGSVCGSCRATSGDRGAGGRFGDATVADGLAAAMGRVAGDAVAREVIASAPRHWAEACGTENVAAAAPWLKLGKPEP